MTVKLQRFFSEFQLERQKKALFILSHVIEDFLKVKGHYGQLSDWNLELNLKKRSFGTCSYNKKTIYISFFQLLHGNSNLKEALDTLRHEMAHALAGPGTKHGPVWRKWAVRLGANPRATSSGNLSFEQKFESGFFKWVAFDSSTLKPVRGWHRKPTRCHPRYFSGSFEGISIRTNDEYQLKKQALIME